MLSLVAMFMPRVWFLSHLISFLKKVRICEWMVLQAPCVRLFATLGSLVIYFEYQDKGLIPLKVLDFITLPSLLAGIYATHILVTTVSRLVRCSFVTSFPSTLKNVISRMS
ncbi:hypothetical protein COOONC_09250 [Cooperia oncophora]